MIDAIVVNRDLRLVIREAPFTGRYDLKVTTHDMYIILKDYFETVWGRGIKSADDLYKVFADDCQFEVHDADDFAAEGGFTVILEDRYKTIADRIKRLVVSANEYVSNIVDISGLISDWFNKLDEQEKVWFVEKNGGLLDDINDIKKVVQAINNNRKKD